MTAARTTTRRTPTAKPADDQPFDFNLDTAGAELELTPWRVHFSGTRWTFAHLEALDVWKLLDDDEARGGQGDEVQVMVSLFKAALGDAQFAEFRKIPLPMQKLRDLFEAYQAYCGVKTGESEGSADS